MSPKLPPPLIPQHVDLREFAYMPLHVSRLRDSRFVSVVSAEAFRAGVLLWCASWHQLPAGSLPNDVRELARLAGYGYFVEGWERVAEEALYGWTLCSDGRYYHEIVCETALDSFTSKLEHGFRKEYDRVRKENARRKEQNLPALPLPQMDTWVAERMASGLPEEFQRNAEGTADGFPSHKGLEGNVREGKGMDLSLSSSSVDISSNLETSSDARKSRAGAPATGERKSTRKAEDRGTRIPEDFELTDALRDWAGENTPKVDADLATREFVEYWKGEPGARGRKLDWLATWRARMLMLQKRAESAEHRGNGHDVAKPVSRTSKALQRFNQRRKAVLNG